MLLIAAYGLGLLFSLKTHREFFGSAEHAETGEAPWPLGLALATLAGVTVLVALVSEVFVESVQQAAVTFGMTPAFVGFIVVALVGGAAEMASAFSGARKNRLDLSVGIALGSASQIALFVAPVLVLLSYVIGPAPMNLQFWPGAVVMMLIATMTASLVTNSGRSAWFVGVLVLMVYLIFAMTLYLLPPRLPVKDHAAKTAENSTQRAHDVRSSDHLTPPRRSDPHVAPISRGYCRQCLQHCDPCNGDGNRNTGGAHRGRACNVASIASTDRRHDCDRIGLDGRASCRSARLVICLHDRRCCTSWH